MSKWITHNIWNIKWSQVVLVILVLTTLGSLIWVLNEIGHRSCVPSAMLLNNEDTSCPTYLEDVSVFIVAICFWLLSILLWWVSRQLLPTCYFLCIAGILAIGLASLENNSAIRVFNILLAFFSPLTLHFHFYILRLPIRTSKKALLTIFYGAAILITIPYILLPIDIQESLGYREVLREMARAMLILSFSAVAFIFFREYRKRYSLSIGSKVRLISFGTIFAFLPMLLLSVLPEVLSGTTLVPYTLTFPGLLFSPLTYIYTFLRHRFIGIERIINRIVLYYMLVVLLSGIYLIVISLFDMTLGRSIWLSPPAIALNVVLLLSLPLLHEALQHLTSWVMYGGEIDYLQIQEDLSKAFSQALDSHTLNQLLLQELPRLLHLDGAILFLKDECDILLLVGVNGFSERENSFAPRLANSAMLAYLTREGRPIPVRALLRVLSPESHEPTEQSLLNVDAISYWLPLMSNHTLQGILLLSGRRSGDYLTANDEHLLSTLMHSAGIAAHNVRLIEDTTNHQLELAKAHRQLLVNREQAQRQIARGLHDSTLQRIIGLKFQLAMLRRYNNFDNQDASNRIDSLNDELSEISRELRQVVGELHPAGLTEMGATNAIEGYLARMRKVYDAELPKIEANLDENTLDLSEPVATCLFRIAQEAIQNAIRHAHATIITIDLQRDSEKIILKITDNGRGFNVPAQLSSLAQKEHYGLVGISEQIQWVYGIISITSTPGQGTQLEAKVPIAEH